MNQILENNLTFNEIWLKFSHPVKDFIRNKTHNADVTDDILQEVFIKIHQNLHLLKDEERVAGWVFQIARNTVLNQRMEMYISEKQTINSITINLFITEKMKKNILSIAIVCMTVSSLFAQEYKLAKSSGRLEIKEVASSVFNGLPVLVTPARHMRLAAPGPPISKHGCFA